MTTRSYPFALRLSLVAVLALIAGLPSAFGQYGAKNGEWHHYGGDNGGTKYSALDQINKDNVGSLQLLWIADSPDKALPQEGAPRGGRAENTPIYVKGTIYTSSPYALVSAIDPKTGATKWTYDPEGYKAGRPTNLGYVHRGLAYWTDGVQERIFIAAHDAYLSCIDAKTGKLVADFGEGGKINLAEAIPRARNARNYTMTSPPVVCRNVVIVGSSISDSGAQSKEMPRGDIQAFDTRTGKPAWIFHTVPQEGEFGNETWLDESWRYTGNTNCWTSMCADDELGYVYVPTGTPTNDWFGGQRPGDNLFAESLLCLDVRNGQRVWHFQTVHHGLWDYDLPSPPVLCDIKQNGNTIKAVAQVTKTGFTWVFDRTNGKPVWPIEERPVPQGAVPDEKLSPTQPFPTKPAPFERQGSTEDNLIDYTPELKTEALAILDKFDHGPIFTPPTEKGTINLPGWGGGANWWGAGFDPETGLLYIPSVTGPITVKLSKPDASRSSFSYIRGQAPPPSGPRGLPLFKGPYGRITAIDLNSGDHAWQIARGDGQRRRVSEMVGHDVGPLGSSGGSGPLVTKTLLIGFHSAGAGGQRSGGDEPAPAAEGPGGPGAGFGGGGSGAMQAYDKATGKVIAEVKIPGRTNCTPMTFMHEGKQMIVVALGDGRLLALGLPDKS